MGLESYSVEATGIKNWAEDDRPREKIMLKGRAALSDAELLAILIGSGTKSLSAVDLSREILNKSNNSFSQLAKLSINELMQFKGIGMAKAVSIFAAMEISRRKTTCGKEKINKIKSSNDAFLLLKGTFFDLRHEEFHVLFLNRANDIMESVQISKGGLSGTVADGKIIFHHALSCKASAIILAHNHPSGQLRPSDADIKLTKSLVAFGKYIDLQVLDHLIFCDNNYFSFADEGLMA